MRGVDALHFLEEVERDAELFANFDEGGEVFRETRAAVADPGVKEIAPDPAIHPDPIRHLFDVGSARFANGGDGIDVGNLEGEEGVGGVLDQLRAVDIGHEDRRHEGLVDLLHETDRLFALCADHDPVRVHEIGHSAAFTEKFRVADDVEARAVLVIALDRLRYFFAGLHRHRALVDDDAIIG